MYAPYTPNFREAFQIAQSSLGVTLGAVAWARPLRTKFATSLLLGAIAIAVLPLAVGDLARGIGLYVPASLVPRAITWAVVLAIGAMIADDVWPLGVLAAATGSVVALGAWHVGESNYELLAATLLWIGALLGCHGGRQPGAGGPALAGAVFWPARRHVVHDVLLVGIAVGLSAAVATFVLRRSCDSADEVANTYQAAVFSKLHAYSTQACAPAFSSTWVFDWQGRQFSQYTPGWPLFMAPFFRFGVVWLAAPCSLGLLVWVNARLARRAVAEGRPEAGPRAVTAAGVIAGLTTACGSTMLINGGARFAHLYCAFCFALAVEALCVLSRPLASSWRNWTWGSALGASTATLLATRPAEGAFLGTGLFLYTAYGLVQKRFGWRGLAAATVTFLLFGGMYLILLRLQVGRWFATAYSLLPYVRPGAKMGYSLPKAHELRFALPLATGSYCWWPCAPALGVAGLLTLRRPAWRLNVMVASGSVAMVGFLSIITYGRYGDWGYGPRFVLPLVVAMAVGGGALLGPLFSSEPAREGTSKGAGGLALTALGVGTLAIMPLVYPYNFDVVFRENQLFRQISAEGIHHAVVIVSDGSGVLGPEFYTQSLPVAFFPEQDVLLIHELDPEAVACVRRTYSDRTFFRTIGAPNVVLRPAP